MKISKILNDEKIKGECSQIPRAYQLQHTKYLLQYRISNDFSEAGTGKSLSSYLYLMAKLSKGQKAVVIMPPTLVNQYVSEFERIITDHPFTSHILKQGPAGRTKLFKKWQENRYPDILFLSFQMWVKCINKILSSKEYSCLIADECHAIKNPATSNWATTYRAIHRNKMSYMGMSGTPITADLTDAYGHIKLKEPDAYLDFGAFERKHIIYRRFDKFKKVVGYNQEDVIKKHLHLHSVRVRSEDVMTIEQPNVMDYHVRLSYPHYDLYKTLLTDRILELGDGEAIVADNQSALRAFAIQLITTPERFTEPGNQPEDVPLDTLAGIIESVPKEDKLLIFCKHRATVEKLEKRFSDMNPSILYGGKNESQKFKDDPTSKLCIANFKAGHAGHNFQMCRNVIMYEADGTPSIINQSIARCHRNGQTRVVNVWMFRYVGTYSDRLIDSATERNDITNYVMKDKNSLLNFLKIPEQ